MDSSTYGFLQDTLHPANPVVPATFNPYQYLQEGYTTANQIDAATKADQASTLTQEQINLLPQTRKFNTSLQSAQARLYGAQADQAEGRAAQARARAAALGQPAPPFTLPASPFDGDSSSGVSAPAATPSAQPITADAPVPSGGDDDGSFDVSGLDDPMSMTLQDTSAAPATGGFSLKNTGPVSNISAPGDDGSFTTTATTFATPADLANYAKTGSLATGDNGKGAWGDNTAGPTPFVALPPSFLRAQGIDPDKARGTPVSVTANGNTVNAVVGDKLPDNSKNGAGIDLNPSLAHSLGIADVNNFKGGVSFKLGHDDDSLPSANSPTFTPAAPAPTTNSDDGLDVDGLLSQNGLVAVSNAFPSQTTNDGAAGSSSTVSGPASTGGIVTKTPGGIKVPANDQDVSDLQYKLSQYATQLQSDPRFSTNAAFKQAVKARLGVLQNEVSHAVSTYQNNRAFTARQAAAAAKTSARTASADPSSGPLVSTDTGTGLPVLPTFTPDNIRVNPNGRLSYDMRSPQFVADEAQRERQSAIDDLNKTVGRAIPGVTVDDLMNDRGNYRDAVVGADGKTALTPGGVTPGTHYFTQTVKGVGGDPDTTREAGVPETTFQRYHRQIPAWAYGEQPAAPASPAPAPILASNVTDAGLDVSGLLNQYGATPLGNAVTTPVTSAASPPAVNVPAATDPTIRLKALADAARQKTNAEAEAATMAQYNIQPPLDAAGLAQRAADRKQAAAQVANNFDYSIFQGKPSSSRFLNPHDDPTGVAGRAVFPKLKEAARAAGVTDFDQSEALRLIQQKRDQAVLDQMLKSADPAIVQQAEILAAREQARQGSLPTGFGTSSVGATDRIIPDSGSR